MANQPPNILLITADQHRGDVLGVEGRRVHTPHLDRLATSGARFTQCITPSPVCQPARASLLTGLLPLTHGVWDNGVDLSEDQAARGFAANLSRAGYQTGLVGKAHFSSWYTFEPTGRPECFASCADYPETWAGPYMGFDHVELALGPENFTPPERPPGGMHYERWYYAQGSNADEMGDLTVGALRFSGTPYARHSVLPIAWHSSTWCADRTIEFVRRHYRQPFMLWTSFGDPHVPFDAPVPWSLLHDPAEVDLPKFRKRDLSRRPWWHTACLEGTPAIDDDRLRELRVSTSTIPELSDEALAAVIANYYGMVSLIDHSVGRIVGALRELGILDKTFIVYTSDHGEWLGDHGLVLKGPMLYEGLLRVPLVISGPGVVGLQCIDAPVSTLDLAATIYDWAGLNVDGGHGRSLIGPLDGRISDREFSYSEWDLHPARCGVALSLRTVRTRTEKLTLDLTSGAAEMYDLIHDPFEMENISESAGAREARARLERYLAQRPQDVIRSRPAPVGIG